MRHSAGCTDVHPPPSPRRCVCSTHSITTHPRSPPNSTGSSLGSPQATPSPDTPRKPTQRRRELTDASGMLPASEVGRRWRPPAPVGRLPTEPPLSSLCSLVRRSEHLSALPTLPDHAPLARRAPPLAAAAARRQLPISSRGGRRSQRRPPRLGPPARQHPQLRGLEGRLIGSRQTGTTRPSRHAPIRATCRT